MKRRDERRRLPRHQRKREVVEMKMHEIEFVGPPIYLFDHHHMERIGIAHGAVEPHGLGQKSNLRNPHGTNLLIRLCSSLDVRLWVPPQTPRVYVWRTARPTD